MKVCIIETCQEEGIWTPTFHFYPPAYFNYTGPPITMASADGKIVSCDEHKLEVFKLFNSKRNIDSMRKIFPPNLRTAAIDPRRTKVDWVRVVVDEADVTVSMFESEGRRIHVDEAVIIPEKDPSKCLHCQGEPTWTSILTIEDVAETHKEEVADHYMACDAHLDQVKDYISPQRVLETLGQFVADEMKMPVIEWVRVGSKRN